MSTRYATIITADEGHEVVSNIAHIEGEAPKPKVGRVVKVSDSVKIGDVFGAKGKAPAKGE